MPAINQAAMAKPVRKRAGYLFLITGVAALGGLLFGYDTAVISGAIGPLAAHFRLNPEQLGWAASSAIAGCVVGSICAGWGSDTFGRRRLLVVAGLCFFISALGTALAASFGAFVLFRILGGVGIGTASVVSPLYIAESSPAQWRGRFVAVNQLAIVLGMLLIYAVNFAIASSGGEEWSQVKGWRWMFASGIFPSVLLLVLLLTVPETARFLLTKGRRRQAEAVALRTGVEVLEEILAAGPVVASAFNQRRMYTVGVVLAVLQQVTGINVFLYYAPLIFSYAGNSKDVALLQTVAVGAVNVVFTLLAMAFVDRIGRKPLLIGGAAGMAVCLIAMGSEVMVGHASAWLLVYVLGYIACFAISVGPVTWILLSELFPSGNRGSVMAVSTAALWLSNFVVSQTFPMIDQSAVLIAAFGHAFPFFLYAVFCALEIWFVAACLPETRNKRLETIAEQWSKCAGKKDSLVESAQPLE